jgi:lysozyme
MKLNEKGIELMHKFEGLKLSSYLCPAKVWTIGYGNTFYEDGSKVQPNQHISQKRANQLFCNIVEKSFAQPIRKLLKVELNENQFSALVSFAYNVGTDIDTDTKAEGLGDSTLLKKVNANPKDPKIRAEFMKWVNKGSKFEKGLTTRRKAEADLYFSPI